MTLETPCFVYSCEALEATLLRIRRLIEKTPCKLLYSLKACAIPAVLEMIADHVDGFSCSSLFEATLASLIAKKEQTIHFTSPCIPDSDFSKLNHLCQYIAFNSCSQRERLGNHLVFQSAYGLRLNPKLSFVDDARYNPCRLQSKLGVGVDVLTPLLGRKREVDWISGIHFHNNCDADSFHALLATVQHLAASVPQLLAQISWVNIGGGYLPNQISCDDDFVRAIDILTAYNIDVFFEPGAGIVQDSGSLMASVHDIVYSDNQPVAILDTSVNHLPEVFEYQFEPDILEENPDGEFEFILAGASCLAGDIFGRYAFDQPLGIGLRFRRWVRIPW